MMTLSALIRNFPEIRVTNLSNSCVQDLVKKVDGLLYRESLIQQDITSLK